MYGKDKNSTLRVLIQGRQVWSNSASTVQNKWARATIQFTPAYQYSVSYIVIIGEVQVFSNSSFVAIDLFYS
jgi:hypothetical protein